eukprot:TRINITY_DN9731_c0_g1_i2.p1 TRINITY_DN9731_c0_g1~~TRINITY_DN9731_c0_g1_i2.p1  ORF type:complete len:131 (+),score=12.96 TRINITY_DN9731_c0_g1_i2:544-936(+)
MKAKKKKNAKKKKKKKKKNLARLTEKSERENAIKGKAPSLPPLFLYFHQEKKMGTVVNTWSIRDGGGVWELHGLVKRMQEETREEFFAVNFFCEKTTKKKVWGVACNAEDQSTAQKAGKKKMGKKETQRE